MNGNDGAFPLVVPDSGYQVGLTKREYFAAMAMQRLCDPSDHHKDAPRYWCALAVTYADALIAELSKVQP